MKDTTKAINNFMKSIELNNNLANAYYFLGELYSELNSYEDAVSNFTSALEIGHPELSDAVIRRERGIAYMGLKNFESAIKDFDFSLNLNPQDTLSYLYRGMSYMEMNIDTMAVNNFKSAIELDSNNSSPYVYLGIIYQKQGKYDDALVKLSRAVTRILMPRNIWTQSPIMIRQLK